MQLVVANIMDISLD